MAFNRVLLTSLKELSCHKKCLSSHSLRTDFKNLGKKKKKQNETTREVNHGILWYHKHKSLCLLMTGESKQGGSGQKLLHHRTCHLRLVQKPEGSNEIDE